MKKILFIVLCSMFYLGCSDPQATEPERQKEDNFVLINGKVLSDSTFLATDLIVTLQADSIYKDTTDENGKFRFYIKSRSTDDYIISIEDSAYFPLTINLFTSTDTTLTVYISSYSDDYFPLKVGSWWSYVYRYYPYACDRSYTWEVGEMIWKIINETNDGTQDPYYTIEETINGLKMVWPPDGGIDTTKVNQTNKIKFYYHSNDFIELGNEMYLNRLLNVKIKRHYKIYKEILIIDCRYGFQSKTDSNIVANEDTGHQVKLKSKVGITYWGITNLSNCSPIGWLTLKDYYIPPN